METDRATTRGIGLAVAVPRAVVTAAAHAVARGGYRSFWLNNPPGGAALDVLGTLAPLVPALRLGVGVIPFSAVSPDEIVAGVRRAAVPVDRLDLGVGSGAGADGVRRVSEGVERLRAAFEGTIVVAALGPRMCRLAGAAADGVLFNWLTPEYAAHAVEAVRAGAAELKREMPRTLAYVRAALGDDATARLRREAATYESYPAYAAHFRRMGTGGMGASIAASSPAEVHAALAAWEGVVDEVVIRVITAHDSTDEVEQLIEVARPG